MSVITSGMQHILCRHMQQKHRISSHELLANTAPAQVSFVQGQVLHTHATCNMAADPPAVFLWCSLDLLQNDLLQSWTLLLAGPLDRYISNTWVVDYAWSMPACVALIASCSMAVLVNISQFMCLGRFSAVSFQVCFAVRLQHLLDT